MVNIIEERVMRHKIKNKQGPYLYFLGIMHEIWIMMKSAEHSDNFKHSDLNKRNSTLTKTTTYLTFWTGTV